jgi:hypothetical protein
MHRKISWIVLVCLVMVWASGAYGQARRRVEISRSSSEPIRQLIDLPTAATLPRGAFDGELRVYADGGVLVGTNIGLSNQLQLGLSYGAEGIISEREPTWNPRVEFQVKLQVITENLRLPAIALGYASQGYGSWVESLDRYEIKSRGFYAVASKGYVGPGGNIYTGLHAGVNYSMEHDVDGDENLNFFFGFDAKLPNDVALVVEYDMALNDDRDTLALGKGWGYLNVGCRWVVIERLMIEASLKNLLSNRHGVNSFGRELRILYLEYF